MEQREKILDATIRVFNRKGLKFTMDDIAARFCKRKKMRTLRPEENIGMHDKVIIHASHFMLPQIGSVNYSV